MSLNLLVKSNQVLKKQTLVNQLANQSAPNFKGEQKTENLDLNNSALCSIGKTQVNGSNEKQKTMKIVEELKSQKFIKDVNESIKTGKMSPKMKSLKEEMDNPKTAFLVISELKKQLEQKIKNTDKSNNKEVNELTLAKDLINVAIDTVKNKKTTNISFKGSSDFESKIKRIWTNEQIFDLELNACLTTQNREKRIIALLAEAETKKTGNKIAPEEIKTKIDKEVDSIVYPTTIDSYLKPIPKTYDECLEDYSCDEDHTLNTISGGLFGMGAGALIGMSALFSGGIGPLIYIAACGAGAALGGKATEHADKNIRAKLDSVSPERKLEVIQNNSRIRKELTPLIAKSLEKQANNPLINEAYRIREKNEASINKQIYSGDDCSLLNITKTLFSGLTTLAPSHGLSALPMTKNILSELIEYDKVSVKHDEAKELTEQEFKNSIKRAIIIESLKESINEDTLKVQEIKRQLTLSNY